MSRPRKSILRNPSATSRQTTTAEIEQLKADRDYFQKEYHSCLKELTTAKAQLYEHRYKIDSLKAKLQKQHVCQCEHIA